MVWEKSIRFRTSDEIGNIETAIVFAANKVGIEKKNKFNSLSRSKNDKLLEILSSNTNTKPE